MNFQLTGILPPWWLASYAQARVWVYGVEDHEPPYQIEFSDGWLALLYPNG